MTVELGSMLGLRLNRIILLNVVQSLHIHSVTHLPHIAGMILPNQLAWNDGLPQVCEEMTMRLSVGIYVFLYILKIEGAKIAPRTIERDLMQGTVRSEHVRPHLVSVSMIHTVSTGIRVPFLLAPTIICPEQGRIHSFILQ